MLHKENVIERRRRCVLCGDRVSTFEVVAGTAITWQAVDDDGWDEPAPTLRSKHYTPAVLRSVKR